MRRRASSRLLPTTLAALGLVALPASAGALPGGAAAPAANSVTFQDSTGEDAAAPDITTIVVSNDDAGFVSFRVNVPNRPTLGQDMIVDLFVDSDNNPATGATELAGVDYVVEIARGEANLFRWDGTNFTRRFGDPPAITLSFSYQAGVTIRISANELGNTRRLNFFVTVESGIVIDPETGDFDFTNAKGDVAPGGGAGLYPYEVRITPPTLIVRRLTAGRLVAGKAFTLRLVAARSDTGAVVQNGRVTCVGRVGAARLRAQVQAVQGGAAVCTWNIPRGAKGKTFRGSVTVVFEGLRASRSFTGRVR
ncbi:MAG TPA: hypothetical protein VNJ53_11155 [Gaiellaceae bacterium]|nr:hypothetical protein [Gaiellaceae bacterium]